MSNNTAKVTLRSFLIFTAANIFVYVFAHLAYIFSGESVADVFELLRFYVLNVLDYISPVVISAIALVVYLCDGKVKAALSVAIISSAKLFYTIPFYYLTFIRSFNYNSVESLLLAIGAGILSVLTLTLCCAIMLLIAGLALKLYAKRTNAQADPSLAYMSEESTYDFLRVGNLPILIFSLTVFLVNLITETVDTVAFFIEYGVDYTPVEIASIMINFALIFLMLVVSYVVASVIKARICKEQNKQ